MKETASKKRTKGHTPSTALKRKTMPEHKVSTGWLIVIVIVILFAVIVWAVLPFFNKPKPVAQNMAPANQVTQVPVNQLPSVFPPNIPLEPNRAVTENFSATSANGQQQATRSFISLKSVGNNIATYEQFFAVAANGWTMISETTSTQGGTLLARNTGGVITVSISSLPPQPYTATQVEITYTTNPQ